MGREETMVMELAINGAESERGKGPSEPDRKARIWELFDRLNRQDTRALAELMHDDLLSHASYAEQRGREEHERHVKAMFRAFPDLRFELEEVFGEGDLVTAHGMFAGTHRGPLMGAPPTGRSILVPWMAVYRFRGDKIAERWQMGDDLGALVQLGLVERPVGPRRRAEPGA